MLNELISSAKQLTEEPRNFANCAHGLPNGLPDECWCYVKRGISHNVHLNLQAHYVLHLNLGRPPCELHVNQKKYHIENGCFFLIAPYTPYRFVRYDEKNLYLIVSFAASPGKLILPHVLTRIPGDSESLVICGNFLKSYLRSNDYWEHSLVLAQLLNVLARKTNPHVVPDPIQALRCFSSEIARFIHDHISSIPDIDEIATHFHCSKSNLRRRFKQETGVTLGNFIKTTRIVHSTFFLTQNEKNISEIAELCGYSSIQAFTRAFKEFMKISPSDYRHQYLCRN